MKAHDKILDILNLEKKSIYYVVFSVSYKCFVLLN